MKEAFPVPYVRETFEDVLDLLADRTEEYGDPSEMLTAIGRVWSALLDLPEPIEPRIVSLMLAGMKLARDSVGVEEKRDNRLDAIAYVAIADAIINR